MFAGDGVVRAEGCLAVAIHDTVLACPVDRHGVPVVAFDVLIRIAEVAAAHGWIAFETIEHACDHAAGHGDIWRKLCCAGAGHEPFVVRVDNGVIVPGAIGNV